MYGVVKWYNIKQGYGFIKSDAGKDFFIHKNEIPFWSIYLKKGEKVKFLIKNTKKGPKATDIKLI